MQQENKPFHRVSDNASCNINRRLNQLFGFLLRCWTEICQKNTHRAHTCARTKNLIFEVVRGTGAFAAARCLRT